MNDKNKLILYVSLIWILIGVVMFVLIINYTQKQKTLQGGLRIDKEYIKSVSGQEAYVNDVYITTMVNFADKCGGNQSFYRFSDSKGRLHGLTLWCKRNFESFTFFYSDKWRKDNYGAR